mgnify:CR=1 FL=1|jgi:hypothetical protein
MRGGGSSKKKAKNAFAKLIGTFLLVLYFIYLSITRRALDIFNCNPTTPDDGNLYTSFTSPECPGGLCQCWTKGHIQIDLVPVAAMTAVCFTLGFPMLVLFILRKNKKRIKLDQVLRALGTGDDVTTNPEAIHTRKMFHKMYYHFKPGKICK